MNNLETVKIEITLQTIADSLELLNKTLGAFMVQTNQSLELLNKTLGAFMIQTNQSLVRLEDLIDSLAIMTKTELSNLEDRLSNRIDRLEEKVDRNHTYSVNQLDNILVHYARREEYTDLNGRLKRVERKVFA